MATHVESRIEPRIPLSRERVLRAAVKVADEGGIESLTMRRLAEVLGAEAMSLYYHVANKDDVLDGIADLIVSEINDVVDQIDLPAMGPDWKNAARRRILAARRTVTGEAGAVPGGPAAVRRAVDRPRRPRSHPRGSEVPGRFGATQRQLAD